MNWKLKIKQCEQAAVRAIRNNGTDHVTGRSLQELREYLLFSSPGTLQPVATAVVKRINRLQNTFNTARQ